jgi:hypothetical protein
MAGGIEGGRPHFERAPTEQHKPPPESQEHPTLPQKSALTRAVEWTRNLYERNGWVILPLAEAGKDSPTLPSRLPTTIFSAPSHDHLIEEPKKGDKNQPPHEDGKDSSKVPQPQSEPKKPLTPEDAAMLDETMRGFFALPERERSEVFDRVIGEDIRRMRDSDREQFFGWVKTLNRIRMQDMDPKNANYLRRLVGQPLDPSLSDEELQRMLDLPAADEPPSDAER